MARRDAHFVSICGTEHLRDEHLRDGRNNPHQKFEAWLRRMNQTSTLFQTLSKRPKENDDIESQIAKNTKN